MLTPGDHASQPGTGSANQPGTASADASLPGARTALILLLAINLFNYLDRYVLAATLPALQRDLFPEGGANTKTLLGALSTAFMVAYMVLAPLFGWLADRWPRWGIIGLAVILWSLASGASGLCSYYLMLLLTRCLVGVGEAAYGPVAPTLISDLYPLQQRGWVLAWFYAAIPVGSALGYALGGLVADSTLGWRWAFYLVVLPGLALGTWCFFMPEPRRGQADLAANSSQPGWRQYRLLGRIPSYVFDCLGMTASTFAVGGIAYWMPDYIHGYRGDSQLSLGAVNAIFASILVVAGLAATLTGGFIGDLLRARFPGSYFLVSGLGMLLGFPVFLAALYTPFPLAWIWIAVTIFCLFLNTGPANTILANVTPPAIRASAFALNIFVIHALGDAISPTIIGAISDATDGDMNKGFLFVSGMMLLSGIFWLWGARYLEQDTRLAPTRLDNP